MPKKIKLNIKNLKVHSFVTALKENEKEVLKAGSGVSFCVCPKTTLTEDPCIHCVTC
jgi:hypothetical protein